MDAGFQQYAWVHGAGDFWFRRNENDMGKIDLPEQAIDAMKKKPEAVLEVGCANGWRLKKIKAKYGSIVHGVDPAEEAIKVAKADGLPCVVATADKLPYPSNSFDMLIYGFCLCFISPEDWMGLAAEADRVLKDNGTILVYDFIGARFLKRLFHIIKFNDDPNENPVYIYHYNWPSLWTHHPGYRVDGEFYDFKRAEICTIVRKSYTHLLDDKNVAGP